MNERILLVDDDANLRRVLAYPLQRAGYLVSEAGSGTEALRLFGQERPDLVLSDVRMAGMDGMELLQRIKTADADMPVVLLTAFGTIQDAVSALKAGAQDYLTKPVSKDELLRIVAETLKVSAAGSVQKAKRERLAAKAPLETMAGQSAAVEMLRSELKRAAPTEATVLLLGESGTGKELAARALHGLSSRAAGPFVAINCAAIPTELLESQLFGHEKGAFTGADSAYPGRFRQASGGTLFLDEIGDMAPPLQAKILRAIQERTVDPVGGTRPVPVDVRLVSATHADLQSRVRQGLFREDLYFRLAVLTIRVAPLRERGEDLLVLMERFYRESGGGQLVLEPPAKARLTAYPWPGNIRELMNLCQRLAILHPGEPISESLLPDEFFDTASALKEDGRELAPGLREMEREAIRVALQRAGGNKSAAARALQVPRHVLLYRLKKYGMEGE